MNQQLNLKKIKCRTCNCTFKLKKVNIHDVAVRCTMTNCDLHSDTYKELMQHARSVNEQSISLPLIEGRIEMEIPDPIVVFVDKNGNNKRSLS